MEQRIAIALFSIIVLGSCIQHTDDDDAVGIQELPHQQMEVNYAKGFKFNYTAQYTEIISRSLTGNAYFEDSIFILHDANYKLPKGSKVISPELLSICCQSSTHLSYIDFFDKLNLVSGLCGMQYVQNQAVLKSLIEGETKEICLGEALQTETLLALDPEVYLVYPFSSEENVKLNEMGVNTFMVAEYLEQHPIARLEWIKVFGLIFNQTEKAESYFEKVEEEYFELVQDEPDTNKNFIFNLPFGESWYTPSSNSLVVTLLQDAGLYYYYQDETGTENTPHSKEEVWEAGALASYWVIIASRPHDFSLADLVEEDEVYGTFKSVSNRQVIFCNSATTDYFIQGVIEPQIMLKDILYATHKIDDHNPRYFHILE